MTSTTDTVKAKAKRFVHKLFDDSDKPLPPPPVDETVLNAFSNLSVTPSVPSPHHYSQQPLYQSGAPFIGGFNPTYSVQIGGSFDHPRPPPFPHAATSPGPLPRPPSMPNPYMGSNNNSQSLTMQYALSPQALSRPSSASAVPTPPSPLSSAASPSAPIKPKPQAQKPSRRRASSDPPSSSDSPTQTQCSGVTKAGKRCTRQVKSTSTLDLVSPDDDEDQTVERFCFQHSKELLGPSGYYARKNGEWINFDDWIPDYLQMETQVALRVEMEKAKTQSDVPGYIYTFEIRDKSDPTMIQLKVGRAVNLVKRIDQWGKQCGSKEQVLRGWYPGTVDEDEDSAEGSLMKGRVKAGEKGPWCHRLERLIHLELLDLLATNIYLEPTWPKPSPQSILSTSTSKKKKMTRSPCPDCSAMHREIFEFQRVAKGKHRGKEWESVVKPVIERWGRFVDLYV